MRTRCVGVGLCALVFVGCDQPVSPTRMGSAPSPPPLITVSGFVVDGGAQPVSGARIEVYVDASPMEAVTDQAGAYRMAFHSRDLTHGFNVSRDGYETSTFHIAARGLPEVTRDLRLHRIWRVTAGDSVSVPIDSEDPLCGLDDYQCRTIRVVQRSGTMVRISVQGPNVGLRRAGVDLHSASSTITMPLAAGEEVSIDIVTWNQLPVTTTVTTASE